MCELCQHPVASLNEKVMPAFRTCYSLPIQMVIGTYAYFLLLCNYNWTLREQKTVVCVCVYTHVIYQDLLHFSIYFFFKVVRHFLHERILCHESKVPLSLILFRMTIKRFSFIQNRPTPGHTKTWWRKVFINTVSIMAKYKSQSDKMPIYWNTCSLQYTCYHTRCGYYRLV